ncbi:MAG: LPS export ABC transporter periplasmic protein LptC [Gammaproteobacteria bacterium]|nr:LPS export ABC transporter periplasmic protein LptC [Gammaproteobacteria bacterium]MCK5479842.1 LPS export ABC transporter periplasmic protein LptC [Gammaproteobacteria bacterium]
MILLFLVVASGWFLQRPETGIPAATDHKRGPDMFADQIEVTVMDESGQPAYRLAADYLRHSPDTERFDLTRPFIEVSRPAGDNWNIASERGQMTDKGDQLWFLGKVSIHRLGSKPLHIRTSDLLVKPDEESAETDNAVSVSAPQYKIDAIGLKADFRKSLLEFRSRVRGTINAAG